MRLDLGDHALVGELHAAQRPRRNAVLLHGLAGTRADWTDILPAFQPSTNAITLDLAGHGDSTAPVRPLGFDQVAESFVRVLNGLQLDRAIWVGYSFGARLLLPFALRYPERVEALVLLSVHPGLEGEACTERRRQDEADARLMETNGLDAWLESWHQRPAFATRRRDTDSWRAEVERKRRTNHAAPLARLMRGLGLGAQPALLERASQIQAPTLLLAGALDPPYLRHAQDLARRIPNGRFEAIPAAGHAVHTENPTAVQDALRVFLHELPVRISARGP